MSQLTGREGGLTMYTRAPLERARFLTLFTPAAIKVSVFPGSAGVPPGIL